MPEQNLNQTDVDILLQQMRGKAVSQRVRRDPLVDLGNAGSHADGASELPRRHRQHRIAAGKQPELGSRDAIPVAQEVQ